MLVRPSRPLGGLVHPSPTPADRPTSGTIGYTVQDAGRHWTLDVSGHWMPKDARRRKTPDTAG